MERLLDGGDPLGTMVMKMLSDSAIMAGVDTPHMHPDELDEFFKHFLLPGAMFWGPVEEMNYITQMTGFYSGEKDTPFFDPPTQMWAMHRFSGLLCMRCMSKLHLLSRVRSIPQAGEDETLETRIRTCVQTGRWPKHALVVFNFGDAHLNAELAWLYLSWMHRGAIATKRFFKKILLRTDKRTLEMPIGYNVIELPEKDWHCGIGATHAGVGSTEVTEGLRNGWRLMSWEGLQLLGGMPYYAQFMNGVRVPNMLLSGFRCRTENRGRYSLVPFVSFDKKKMELQLGYNTDENVNEFYGHGVIRHLGPLQKFIA